MILRLRKLDWGLIIAMILPLITALPTWGDGIVAAADVEVHVHRIHAMSLALQEGNFYPRWIEYLHLGYGYPIFNFYAPGYAYFTALFELAGLPITVAYNLVQTLAWSVGSVGMYLLARRFMPPTAAVLAAALWVYAPSRLYEVWWQGSIAQILSASFIPFLLLGVIKNSYRPTLRTILAIALPYAILIMTHTPMMYISTLYAAPLAFFAPIYLYKRDYKTILRRWVFIGSGFVLGIGLASIFLIPTLLELQYIQISQGLDETVNYLLGQYLPVTEIFTLPRLIDSTDIYLDFPRTLGLVGGILSLFGIVALIRRKQYGLVAMTVAGLGFTVFMLLDMSFDVWMTIPAFANLRFPARLLRIGAVLIALLGGASVLLLPKKWQFMGMVTGILVVVAQILPISKPYDVWLNWDNISAYDEILHEWEDRTWGTVSYDEFNPIWGDRIFLDLPPEPEIYIDNPFDIHVFGRDIAAVNWQGYEYENIEPNVIRVITDIDRAVRFRQYYFPGWRATVNGERAEIYPEDEIGLITVDLPAGEHIVQLDYVGTPVQLTGAVITWLSIITCFALYRLGKRREPDESNSDEALAIVPSVGLIVTVMVFAWVNVEVIQENGWFKLNSPPTDPAYMATEMNISFGEQITLLGYTLHDDSISESSLLDIDLYWQVPESIETNYRPVVQLLSLSRDSAWATSSRLQSAAGEFSNYAPDVFARDPYRLRLFETGVPPYVGQISVQIIGDNGALLLPDGSDRLILEPIIRINGANDDLANETSIAQIGDIAELVCASVTQADSTYDLTLQWHFTGETDRELVVMTHGLDSDGEVIENSDGVPFSGNYPSQFWQNGQILFETRQLPYNENIENIAIALYTRDTVERLSVTDADDMLLSNNQVIISVSEATCER